MIESTGVNVTDTAVVITIPGNAFRYLNSRGLILFKLNAAIPESAATLPIRFSSGNFTQPLTLVGGAAATGAQMNGQGVYQIYYAKCSSTMQLLTYGVTAATEATASTGGSPSGN
jgi:hypothetical protein